MQGTSRPHSLWLSVCYQQPTLDTHANLFGRTGVFVDQQEHFVVGFAAMLFKKNLGGWCFGGAPVGLSTMYGMSVPLIGYFQIRVAQPVGQEDLVIACCY